MRVGLVIYGSIETLTGGYLYDRRLLDHLASRGDRAEAISLAPQARATGPLRVLSRHWAA